MKEKNIKIIGIIIISFSLYAILFYFLNIPKKETEGYIIISNLGGYYCKGQSCEYKKNTEIQIENESMKIYQQNKFINIYTMEYNDRWNFFKNQNWEPIYGDFLGVSESLEPEILELTYEKLSSKDLTFLKEILNSQGIEKYNKLTEETVIIVDLDGNGEKDRIISTSNQNGEVKEETYFKVLFIILNGKKIEISVETSKEMNLQMNNVFAVLKLNEEESTKIITNNGFYDQMGISSVSMYEVNNQNIKEISLNNLK